MARVKAQRPPPRSQKISHRKASERRKPSYKVVFEEVSEKRKLKLLLSFDPQPPPGYTFIPAGDPQLTSRCKKVARELNSTVYVVSTSRSWRPEISQEVQRAGYHFSSVVVETACQDLGVTLTEAGRVARSSFASLNEQNLTREYIKKRGKQTSYEQPTFDINLSQATIDTQAREAITDLFPKIPAADLHQVVARSFQKGRGLVGTQGDLSLVRRAQLAVLAHIRHTHTRYDQLLREVQYLEARKQVEAPTLDKLVEWRGDDDEDTDIMHEVLREVIVIPDDDEDDGGPQQNVSKKTKDPSRTRNAASLPREPAAARRNTHETIKQPQEIVDLISSPLVETQPLVLAAEDFHEPEISDHIQYIRPAEDSFDPYHRLRQERSTAQRLQRWEEALQRQKAPERHYDRNASLSIQSGASESLSGFDGADRSALGPRVTTYIPQTTTRQTGAEHRPFSPHNHDPRTDTVTFMNPPQRVSTQPLQSVRSTRHSHPEPLALRPDDYAHALASTLTEDSVSLRTRARIPRERSEAIPLSVNTLSARDLPGQFLSSPRERHSVSYVEIPDTPTRSVSYRPKREYVSSDIQSGDFVHHESPNIQVMHYDAHNDHGWRQNPESVHLPHPSAQKIMRRVDVSEYPGQGRQRYLDEDASFSMSKESGFEPHSMASGAHDNGAFARGMDRSSGLADRGNDPSIATSRVFPEAGGPFVSEFASEYPETISRAHLRSDQRANKRPSNEPSFGRQVLLRSAAPGEFSRQDSDFHMSRDAGSGFQRFRRASGEPSIVQSGPGSVPRDLYRERPENTAFVHYEGNDHRPSSDTRPGGHHLVGPYAPQREQAGSLVNYSGQRSTFHPYATVPSAQTQPYYSHDVSVRNPRLHHAHASTEDYIVID